MNTNAEIDLPPTGKVEIGKKLELGNCPKCAKQGIESPLTNMRGVVRCTRWSCDFIEGFREFVEGKHLKRLTEESLVERNLVNIEKEERKRDKQFRTERARGGILSRLGFGRR